MIPKPVAVCAGLAALARATQPGAVEPVPAPMRNLTWGKLNFLHTTDTHGWLGGHLREPQYSADWGDYISFASHMRDRAASLGADLLLVDTGDRVDGNGLYDASSPKGTHISNVLRGTPFDIVTTGNHELYVVDTARREHEVTVPDFSNVYLASNLDYIDPDTGERVPQAPQRFRRFKTPNAGIEVLAFGFLFDFTKNANNTVVQPVEDTVKEAWFADEVTTGADVIVVAGHVGLRQEEFKHIYAAIRQLNWFTPVLFFGGHRHVRDALSYDSRSFAIASGRYLETVGFASVDKLKLGRRDAGPVAGAAEAAEAAASSPTFFRRYLDNNLLGYRHHTGLDESAFPTKQGARVSGLISHARATLELDQTFGCAPRDLWMDRAAYPSPESIYSWLTDEVLPDMVVSPKRADAARLIISHTGGIRFDVLKGPFTRDSAYIVAPFNDHLRFIRDVPYAMAKKVLGLLNSQETILSQHGLDTTHLTTPRERDRASRLRSAESESQASMIVGESRLELRSDTAARKQHPLAGEGEGGSAYAADEPALTVGYTTKDDIGDDGDDTVHAKMTVHAIPNCVQAQANFPKANAGRRNAVDGDEGGHRDEDPEPAPEPEKVDLVFVDYVQQWMMPALRLAGGDYDEDDVELYMSETFTGLVTAWITNNWKC